MLTPGFYERYRVLPTRSTYRPAYAFYRAWVAATRTRIDVEGWDRLPDRPAILATNSTQKQDFMALRVLAEQRGVPCVTVTKAKNYHQPVMAWLLGRLGVVPIASKGYFLLVDFTQTLGRRPTDPEYRAVRDHVDRGTDLPPGPLQLLLHRPRQVVGHRFDPAQEAWRTFLRRIYRQSLQETVRLAREAADAGYHIQMYPEGTVSPTLGQGRIGAVQLAVALGLPLLPVGMSGCPDAFWGDSPLVRGGRIQLRVGELLPVPPDLVPASFVPFDPDAETTHRAALQGLTDTLMDRIDALLDPPFRRRSELPVLGKGTRAFL